MRECFKIPQSPMSAAFRLAQSTCMCDESAQTCGFTCQWAGRGFECCCWDIKMFVPHQRATDWAAAARRTVTLQSAKKQRPLLERDLIKPSIRLAHLPLVIASDARPGTKVNRRGCWLSILRPVPHCAPARLVAPGCASSPLACQSHPV